MSKENEEIRVINLSSRAVHPILGALIRHVESEHSDMVLSAAKMVARCQDITIEELALALCVYSVVIDCLLQDSNNGHLHEIIKKDRSM